MRFSRFLKTAVCLLALVFTFAPAASSRQQDQSPDQSQDQNQDPTGGIRGTVSDASGNRVPDARITVSGGPGAAGDATGDDAGDYVVQKLPAGTYHLLISAKGYKDFEQDGVEVTADIVEVDATLEADKDTKSTQRIIHIHPWGDN